MKLVTLLGALTVATLCPCAYGTVRVILTSGKDSARLPSGNDVTGSGAIHGPLTFDAPSATIAGVKYTDGCYLVQDSNARIVKVYGMDPRHRMVLPYAVIAFFCLGLFTARAFS